MNFEDQVEELEDEIERLEAENFRLATKIERLERWKTDATYVINAWEEAWESAAVPDNLGKCGRPFAMHWTTTGRPDVSGEPWCDDCNVRRGRLEITGRVLCWLCRLQRKGGLS